MNWIKKYENIESLNKELGIIIIKNIFWNLIYNKFGKKYDWNSSVIIMF
jgi:hypothetical protein